MNCLLGRGVQKSQDQLIDDKNLNHSVGKHYDVMFSDLL